MSLRIAAAAALAGASLATPEQVHLALGKTTSELNVEWVTQDTSDDVIMWGQTSTNLPHTANGDSVAYTKDEGRKWYTHTATMNNLEQNTEYYYKVGNNQTGFSDTFKVMNRRTATPAKPFKHILFGDMGSACAFSLCEACTQSSQVCDAKTCATNRTNVGLIAETDADMFLHVGDFAYNLADGNGTVGDQFFRNIEQVAARGPYMVSHGNHEDTHANLAHYLERFRLMPSNAVPPTYLSHNGRTTNSLYFSWDHGLVHYVAISTEMWFGTGDLTANLLTMLEWLKDDLKKANANRDKFPWIIVHGHRSIYCSCDKDCDAGAELIRLEMEPILFDNGVDFFINGHEHNYERMWPTYKSKSDQSNINPRATVYVVTGAAGSHEMHEPFTKPQPSWSAFRSNSFSYTRMYVYNASHIHWQQVQTDPTLFPGSDYGRVIDDTWFVQNRHGPFNASLAPKEKPTTCGSCKEHDHWAPLLELEDGSGRSMVELISEFREKNGDDAWRAKLNYLMSRLQSNLTVWEDVRGDGNSDGAWAEKKGFQWKGGSQ